MADEDNRYCAANAIGHASNEGAPMYWSMTEADGDCPDDRPVYVAHTWVEARDLACGHLGVPYISNKTTWLSSNQKPRGPVVLVGADRFAPRDTIAVGPEMVDQPRHYNSHPSQIPAIDAIEWLPGNLFTALKYAFRFPHKGASVLDRQKSLWYLRRECQRMKSDLFSKTAWLEALEIESPILRKVQEADPDTLLGRCIKVLLEKNPIDTRLSAMITIIEASFAVSDAGDDAGTAPSLYLPSH